MELTSGMWCIQVTEHPATGSMLTTSHGYQPRPWQNTLRVTTQDGLSVNRPGSRSLTPVSMSDQCPSPALTCLSAKLATGSRQPSPLSITAGHDDDSNGRNSIPEGLAQGPASGSSSSDIKFNSPGLVLSSQIGSLQSCEDVKEEKLVHVGHTKAVLRKNMKKDPLLNSIFEHIHADFYLLAITDDLFIENVDCNMVVQRLAQDMFCRSGIPPFEIQDSIVATLARDIKSWRSKLKKHLVNIVPSFYGVGPGVDGSTVQEIVRLSLSNSNFAFRSYSLDPGNPQSGALEHLAIMAVLDYTFALKELKPNFPMAHCQGMDSYLAGPDPYPDRLSTCLPVFSYALTMIKYILNQYKSGSLADPQQEFSSSEYSEEWAKILRSLNEWRMKPNCIDDWNWISNEYGKRALAKLGFTNMESTFVILDTD
ncbi:uncharacterized protein EI90DRAFT_3130131 [Cantharellus anzutake]|uniref:uncharacterized protein n=1 Tax=Cantharellus anzutake TaxID=1750568 RepID=UPI0019036E24|nr:uncharacterized protein EI90DRAFT_3130131 [Cantharellus anzutake]KAF8324182.1 hypothetical protein EI90DRAFT_3130131 [Cantharellus anzutake]